MFSMVIRLVKPGTMQGVCDAQRIPACCALITCRKAGVALKSPLANQLERMFFASFLLVCALSAPFLWIIFSLSSSRFERLTFYVLCLSFMRKVGVAEFGGGGSKFPRFEGCRIPSFQKFHATRVPRCQLSNSRWQGSKVPDPLLPSSSSRVPKVLNFQS